MFLLRWLKQTWEESKYQILGWHTCLPLLRWALPCCLVDAAQWSDLVWYVRVPISYDTAAALLQLHIMWQCVQNIRRTTLNIARVAVRLNFFLVGKVKGLYLAEEQPLLLCTGCEWTDRHSHALIRWLAVHNRTTTAKSLWNGTLTS